MGKARGKGGFLCFDELYEMGQGILIIGCCCACIGPVLFLIGFLTFTSAASDPRGDKLAEFQTYINSWEPVRTEFAKATFNVSGQVLSEQTGTSEIVDSRDDVPAYEGLYYRSSVDMSAEWGAAGGTATQEVTFNVRSSDGGASPPITFSVETSKTTVQSASELTPACRTSSTTSSTGEDRPQCSSVCSDNGGLWDGTANTCTTQQTISAICIKVKQDGSTWVLDSSFGGAGCEYPTYQPASYTTSTAATYSSVTMTVRAGADPVFGAQQLTEGSMDFGATRGEKVKTGLTLMVIGGGLSCCIYGGLAAFGYQMQQNKRDRQSGSNNYGNNHNNTASTYNNDQNNVPMGQPYEPNKGGAYSPPPPASQPPPSGGYQPPPSGGYQPPPSGGYQPPPSGGYQPPPSGGYQPPPSGGYQPAAYAPPPGNPPPSNQGYAPPPGGPPPSSNYAPPPGAPPPAY